MFICRLGRIQIYLWWKVWLCIWPVTRMDQCDPVRKSLQLWCSQNLLIEEDSWMLMYGAHRGTMKLGWLHPFVLLSIPRNPQALIGQNGPHLTGAKLVFLFITQPGPTFVISPTLLVVCFKAHTRYWKLAMYRERILWQAGTLINELFLYLTSYFVQLAYKMHFQVICIQQICLTDEVLEAGSRKASQP